MDFLNFSQQPEDQQDDMFNLTPSFSIFRQNVNDKNLYKICGTGFFINDKGVFITAGHVLRLNVDYFIGFTQKNKNIKLYKVHKKKEIYKEPYYNVDGSVKEEIRYFSKYQCGPEYIDVGMGQINTINNTPYYTLTKKRPKINDKIHTFGFFMPREYSNGVKLENDRIPYYSFKSLHVELEIKYPLAKARYPDIDALEDKRNYFNNCLLLDGESRPGLSGCPVLNKNGIVVGMILAGHSTSKKKVLIHLSKYIGKKAKKLNRGMLKL